MYQALHRDESHAYYVANRVKHQQRYRANAAAIKQRNQQTRADAIAIYGGCCVICEATEKLEFDHVNNDGEQHRTIESHHMMLRRIVKAGARITDYELQLLCRHHHHAKPKMNQQKVELAA